MLAVESHQPAAHFPCRAAHPGVVFLCFVLATVGCAYPEVARDAPVDTQVPFSPSGRVDPPDRWWTSFGNPELDRHIELALQGNLTLAASLERLHAARALARREASDLFPDVDGILTTDRTFGSGPDQTSIVWGLDAAWQVDLWGQIEARAEAEQFRADATHADYHAVALSVAAEVARTWFALIEAHAQLELLNVQLDTNRTGLVSQELRFGRGFVRSADVLRQRQLVESTREQQVVVQAQTELLEHQLAVLLGQPPQAASYYPGAELPTLPPLPNTGLPSELLLRRPDVRRDYLAFVAADHDLAAAVSARYPRISLTGSVVNAARSPETLFQDWFVSIGSQLIAPLLDGGQRWAEVERTSAVAWQRFHEYGETILNAFREVEDNLTRERYQVLRIERLNSQVSLAQQAAEQLREQYLIGDADYLDVLSAIQAQQRLQRETLSARLDLILIRIGLYLALAGDFDTDPQGWLNLPAAASSWPPEPQVLPPPQELLPPAAPAPELGFDE